MSQINSLWKRQFVEGIIELTKAYNKFDYSRDLEDFDHAYQLREEWNEAYDLSFDLLDYVELGRAQIKNRLFKNLVIDE